MPLNGEMALILRYFAELGSFRGQLRKMCLITDSLPRNITKYTNSARRTSCAHCDSGASCS